MDNTTEDVDKFVKSIKTCQGSLFRIANDLEAMSISLSGKIKPFNREVQTLQKTVELLSHAIKQGKDRGNYKTAFRNATEMIRNILQENPKGFVEISILAVAASFSWDWIVSDLIPLFGNRKISAKCNIQMLIVDHNYEPFIKAGFNDKGKKWSELSKERPEQAKNLFDQMDPNLKEKFSFTMRYYKNLPHWHGVLIQNCYLLLSRADWCLKGNPKVRHLRVGENNYREFDVTAEQGADRLDIFRNWFEYYTSVSSLAFSSNEPTPQ